MSKANFFKGSISLFLIEKLKNCQRVDLKLKTASEKNKVLYSWIVPPDYTCQLIL